jgi:hypothetical protein
MYTPTHLQQLTCDVEQLLKLAWALQLGLLALCVLVLLEQRQQGLSSGVQLELLFGSTICGARGQAREQVCSFSFYLGLQSVGQGAK